MFSQVSVRFVREQDYAKSFQATVIRNSVRLWLPTRKETIKCLVDFTQNSWQLFRISVTIYCNGPYAIRRRHLANVNKNKQF